MTIIHFQSPSDFPYPTEIVGENSYQKNIRDVVMYKDMVDSDDMEHRDTQLTATLILEDNNKYDPGNAVRVEIDGKTVGYLSKEDAFTYRKSLAKKELTNVVAMCPAVAFGKREEEGKMMKFGIWLGMDVRQLVIDPNPPKKKSCFLFATSIVLLIVSTLLLLG